MAVLKTIEEIEKYIPSKKTWLTSVQNNVYFRKKNIDRIYAFLINPASRKIKKAYRTEMVVYKGKASAFLIIGNYSEKLSSENPYIKKNISSIHTGGGNEWGFEIDNLGVKVKTNSSKREYIVYFGTCFEDLATITKEYSSNFSIKPKKTVITETVYV